MAGKRVRIGIVYNYNENWIGGTYYLENLVTSLNGLPDAEKPVLILVGLHEQDIVNARKRIQYPYLELKKYALRKRAWWERVADRVSVALRGKTIIDSAPKGFDVVFAGGQPLRFHASVPVIYWIADFQEKHLKAYFSEEELTRRHSIQEAMIQSGDCMLFSSRDAANDFRRFFPAASIQTEVLPFVVYHPPLPVSAWPDVAAKYGIQRPFFMAPNQFWVHKNHKVVIAAMDRLKRMGVTCDVFFTGKDYDYRYPGYLDELKREANRLGLTDCVHFLGFIDRADQLLLMQHAVAVVQPSRFEGWSTVVEDAKVLGKQVIASDLAVHREQLGDTGLFFCVDDAEALAAHMQALLQAPPRSRDYDYPARQLAFARGFMDIVQGIKKAKR